MTTPVEKAFKLINSDLSNDELLEKVDELYEETEGLDSVLFGSVYEAMIVAKRHPDYER